jgi:hypothetical protein
MDALHPRQVDHEAALTHRVARDVVAAATNRHEQIVVTGEIDRADDVGHPGTADNQGGPFVNHGVPDLTRLIVPGIAGTQQFAPQAGLQVLNSGFLENCMRAHSRDDCQI